MGIRLVRVLVALVLALMWASPVRAQASRITASGGYQFLNPFAGDSSSTGSAMPSFEKGWYADIGGNLTRNVSAVFQVGGSYMTYTESGSFEDISISLKLNMSIYQYLGGIRMTAHPANAPVKPFAHALFGAARLGGNGEVTFSGGGVDGMSASDNASVTKATMQLGGGVDYMITDGFGVRGGVDYGHIFNFDTDGAGLKMFRFAVGAVFPF